MKKSLAHSMIQRSYKQDKKAGRRRLMPIVPRRENDAMI